MVFQLRHITKVQEVWRFSHNNNSRKAKHSAKMHFALLAHVLKKKTKYRLFLHALRDLRHFLWSVYLTPIPSFTHCTVDKNHLICLIWIFRFKRKGEVNVSLMRLYWATFKHCATYLCPVVFDLNFKTIEHDFVENRLAHYLLDYSLSFCASKVSTRKIGRFKVNFWKELDKWYLLIFRQTFWTPTLFIKVGTSFKATLLPLKNWWLT